MLRTCLLGAAVIAVTAGPAFAEFEIEEAETEENMIELQITTGLFLGGVDPGEERFATETEIIWGVIHGFSTGLSFEVGGERGESPEIEQMELESTFAIIGEESLFGLTRDNDDDGPEFSLALFTGVEYFFEQPDDIVLAVGPAFSFGIGEIESITNLFLAFPLGGGTKTGFSYGTSLMYEATEYVAVGIEAYGTIDSVFDGPPSISRQEHFAGPAILFELEPEEGREVGIRLGGFFGLTRSTPDFAVSLNVELEFN